MPSKLKPYQSYKPSGVEWLGDIPAAWKIDKIKHSTIVKGRIGWQGLKTDEYLDSGFAYLITGTDFKDWTVNWSSCPFISKERYVLDSNIQIKEGDLLITKDGTIGKTAIVKGLKAQATLNSGIFLVRITKDSLDKDYLHWILNSGIFSNFINYTKTGSTISHLYQNVFVEFSFPTPTKTEQTRIAEFLDVECGKIDALIEKSEKMLALLDEKRQAVITHYVTKGTNPTAPLKPSGIDWLGNIPADWEAVKLRFLCKINTGVKDTENYVQEGAYPFFVRSDTVERIDTYSYDGEAVLTAGDGVGVGKVFHYYNGKFDFHQRVYAFTNFRKITGKYFYMTFANFFKYQMYLNSAKSTVDSVRLPFLQNFVFPIPTISEQVEIIKTIEVETAKVNALKEKIIKQIELLKERKTSLITAAVAGKIDVRDYNRQSEAA